MTKDEALKLALDALKTLMIERGSIYDKAITAIEEALAQPEPVALETVYETIIQWDEGGGKRSRRELARRIVSLYTTPPQPWEKFCDSNCVWTDHHPDCKLAEQEPVTWRYKILDYFGRPVWTFKTPKTDIRVFESQPLYTSPPPVAEPHKRKPLTDEEVNKLVDDEDWYNDPHGFVRVIEAAHGIKGEA